MFLQEFSLHIISNKIVTHVKRILQTLADSKSVQTLIFFFFLISKDLNVSSSFLHRYCLVPVVLLTLAFRTDAAAIQKTEALEGKLMNLTGLTVNVMEWIHQTMVLKFGILQMGSEVGFAVGNQTRQAGFERFARGLHTAITQHVL